MDFSTLKNLTRHVNRLFILVYALLIAGCATKPTVEAPPKPIPKPKVALGYTPKFYQYDQLQTEVWKAYGIALHTCSSQHPYQSFFHEVCARKASVQKYRELSEQTGRYNKSLYQMSKADANGFLEEYCWHYLKKPHWLKPSGLGLGKFNTWQTIALPGHNANKNPGVFLLDPPMVINHNYLQIKHAYLEKANPGYPDNFNQFRFKGFVEYQPPLGEHVRYKSRSGNVSLDGYIYPMPTLNQQPNPNQLMMGLYSSEKLNLLTAADQAHLQELKTIDEHLLHQPPIRTPIVTGTYRYRSGGDYFYRSIFLTHHEQQRIKVVINQWVLSPYELPRDYTLDALGYIGWAIGKIGHLPQTNSLAKSP